jgi:hypothetical protein
VKDLDILAERHAVRNGHFRDLDPRTRLRNWAAAAAGLISQTSHRASKVRADGCLASVLFYPRKLQCPIKINGRSHLLRSVSRLHRRTRLPPLSAAAVSSLSEDGIL